MQRNCDYCGRPYYGLTAKSRFCGDQCRKRHHRGAKNGADPKATAAVLKMVGSPTGSVTSAVTESLAEQIATPQGQVALVLAARLDSPDGETGASLAALARQLVATLSGFDEVTETVADPLDELRAKRLAMRST